MAITFGDTHFRLLALELWRFSKSTKCFLALINLDQLIRPRRKRERRLQRSGRSLRCPVCLFLSCCCASRIQHLVKHSAIKRAGKTATILGVVSLRRLLCPSLVVSRPSLVLPPSAVSASSVPPRPVGLGLPAHYHLTHSRSAGRRTAANS